MNEVSPDIFVYLGFPPRLPQETPHSYSQRVRPLFYQKIFEFCQFNISMGRGNLPPNCSVEQFSTAVSEIWTATLVDKFEELPENG